VRAYVLGEIDRSGGSVSRLSEDIYREAADVAYYLHWSKGEILKMSGRERRIWLKQIGRIHRQEQAYRQREWLERTAYLQQSGGEQ
jgi:hypothetical protein